MRRALRPLHLAPALVAMMMMMTLRVAAAATPVGTCLTYQGLLKEDGTPVTESYDFQCKLYDASIGGNQVGLTPTPGSIEIAEGLFTLDLDFGPGAFDGNERWLEIGLRLTGVIPWTTLSPRQKITPAPYAIFGVVPNPLHLANVAPQAAVLRGENNDNNDDAIGVEGVVTGGSAQTIGVRGESASWTGHGVHGVTSGGFVTAVGVFGEAPASISGEPDKGPKGVHGRQGGWDSLYEIFASGVFGESQHGYGVLGVTEGDLRQGVRGIHQALTGEAIGVLGDAASDSGVGVKGWAWSGSGLTTGVLGEAESSALGLDDDVGVSGVLGRVSALSSGAWSAGVRGINSGPDGVGVVGIHNGAGIGVYGRGTNSSTGFGGYFVGRGYFSDRVGIGTTTPNAWLHVDAGLSNLNPASFNNNSIGTATIGFGNAAANGLGLYDPLSDRHHLAGNLGLGVLGPTFQLQLSLNSAAKPTSNTWTISSDRRLKKNIAGLEGSLERLLELRGVRYQWIDPASQGGMDGTYPGLIAQDVEEVFPEWISTDGRGFKALSVIGFEALAVEALRELRAEKDSEIAALRERLDDLEALVNRLAAQQVGGSR